MRSYQPRRQADETQRTALAKMRGQRAFALLMAMRTRKTKVVLDDFGEQEMYGRAKDLLVLAPGGVYRTWAAEIGKDFSDDLRARAEVLIWSSAYTPAQLKLLLPPFLACERPRVLLMNIEALSLKGRARDLVLEFLGRRPQQTYVVIDESTVIKALTKRTRFVLEKLVSRAAFRRIVSGLATPRSLMDIYYQFYFLDPGIFNVVGKSLSAGWHEFRERVAYLKTEHWGGRSVLVIDKARGIRGFKPEAIEAVKARIEPYSFRVEFRPNIPSTFTRREVELTEEQKKAYAEMLKFATTKLTDGSNITATVVIAQLVRLHQILLGHVIDENGNERLIPELRTQALLELLQDYGGKAIIWCSYDFDVQRLATIVERAFNEPVMRFWGGNVKTREEEELRFRTDPDCRFMVATPDAGGKGRTWDVADLAVFYSNRDNLELRDQAEQRTMGRDKLRGVDNVDLVVPGTVDEKILHALRSKINMTTEINGDNWRDWVV